MGAACPRFAAEAVPSNVFSLRRTFVELESIRWSRLSSFRSAYGGGGPSGVFSLRRTFAKLESIR